MKPISTALLALMRASEGLPIAECFTFYTANMQPYYFTNADIDVQIGTTYFFSNSVQVSGMRFRCSTGLSADQQQIQCYASPDDKINNVPFLKALMHGVFDGGFVQRQRAIFDPATFNPKPNEAPMAAGSVQLFYGKISDIPSVGRTSATINVKSLMIMLDQKMPRNCFQPSCSRTLYDKGCGLNRSSFMERGTIGSGSTTTSIRWAGAGAQHVQGTVTITSGDDIYDTAMVSGYGAGVLYLYRPLKFMPAVGDSFNVTQGCDHTQNTCETRFLNLKNFRGFPFIPPAQTAY